MLPRVDLWQRPIAKGVQVLVQVTGGEKKVKEVHVPQNNLPSPSPAPACPGTMKFVPRTDVRVTAEAFVSKK